MRCRASRVLRGLLAVLLLVQAGCSAANRPGWLQEPGWNKPWTYRSGVAAAVCAAIGAGAGVGIQEARTSCATVNVNGQQVRDCQSISDSGDDTFWVWGALIGAASGAVLCGLLGHVFLDPAAEVYAEAPTPLPEITPEPEPPVKQRIVLRGINFDFNSDVIGPDSRPVLDQAAEILKENPGVQVVVKGFTDSVGSVAYNQALSVRRAEAVYRYLVNQGVDPERLTVQGFGMSDPIADNSTEAGRAQNRRVELHPQQ
jgi:outer membrane protein OmpA-like peptidoglycan-associated protein